MKHNIILIGFMGSGKSSVGLRLSYRLRMPVVDTDKLIEQRAGMSISDIFAAEGEESFRERERECLLSLMQEKGKKIISTGGGLPLRQENRELLKELGQVVYLRARPDTIYGRVKHDTGRPLLQTDDPQGRIRELLEQRRELYEAAADDIIDVDGRDFGSIIQELVLLYHKRERRQSEKGRGKRKNMQILVINGPNLNFLGIREKAVYGAQDYDYLLRLIGEKGDQEGCKIEVFQSNHEGAIIDRIQDAYSDGTEGIVINPGAYTHYSYAIRDALASVSIPKVEIHISDIMNREEFRKVSVTAPACDKQIYGQGLDGYLQAIDYILGK